MYWATISLIFLSCIMVYRWWMAIDHSSISDIVYIDMTKALDRMAHFKLLLIIDYLVS